MASLHWPYLLLTFGLRAAVVSSCAPWKLVSPCTTPPSRDWWCCLQTFPGQTVWLHALHGSGKPRGFLSSQQGQQYQVKLPRTGGTKWGSFSSFVLIFLFTEHAVGIWVKWSVDFHFCVSFKRGLLSHANNINLQKWPIKHLRDFIPKVMLYFITGQWYFLHLCSENIPQITAGNR